MARYRGSGFILFDHIASAQWFQNRHNRGRIWVFADYPRKSWSPFFRQNTIRNRRKTQS